jgi:hypothetical protein
MLATSNLSGLTRRKEKHNSHGNGRLDDREREKNGQSWRINQKLNTTNAFVIVANTLL